MKSIVERPIYLQKLIDRRNNGEIKIITGSRRCIQITMGLSM